MPLLRQVLQHGSSPSNPAVPVEAGRLGHTLERFLSSGPTAWTAPEHDQAFGSDDSAGAQALGAILKTVREVYAPSVTNGVDLLHRLEQSRLLPTGCASIDRQLLRGGLREGQLTEVCGESASGKTQLCLMAAAQTAARGERVVYIDTSNAFSARRLLGLLQAVKDAKVAVEQTLTCISVHRAYDAHTLLGLLDGLLRLQPPLPSLLVVDSLSAVITPILGGGAGQHSQGHAVLAAVAVALKFLAERAGAAVVVTNHMVGGGEGGRGEKRPAMGESWRNQPHTRIHLGPVAAAASAAGPQEGGGAVAGEHVAILRASTTMPAGASASYWLGPEGLVGQPTQQAVAAAGGPAVVAQ